MAYSADALEVGPRGTANLRLNAHAIYIVRKLRVAGVQVGPPRGTPRRRRFVARVAPAVVVVAGVQVRYLLLCEDISPICMLTSSSRCTLDIIIIYS